MQSSPGDNLYRKSFCRGADTEKKRGNWIKNYLYLGISYLTGIYRNTHLANGALFATSLTVYVLVLTGTYKEGKWVLNVTLIHKYRNFGTQLRSFSLILLPAFRLQINLNSVPILMLLRLTRFAKLGAPTVPPAHTPLIPKGTVTITKVTKVLMGCNSITNLPISFS